MAKITMNEEIPQVIRFEQKPYEFAQCKIFLRIVKRSFRAKQMDVSLKYSALYHMCNYKVTVFSNTVLIQSFYIQSTKLIQLFRMKIKRRTSRASAGKQPVPIKDIAKKKARTSPRGKPVGDGSRVQIKKFGPLCPVWGYVLVQSSI